MMATIHLVAFFARPGTGATCQRIGGDGCNTSCRIE